MIVLIRSICFTGERERLFDRSVQLYVYADFYMETIALFIKLLKGESRKRFKYWQDSQENFERKVFVIEPARTLQCVPTDKSRRQWYSCTFPHYGANESFMAAMSVITPL